MPVYDIKCTCFGLHFISNTFGGSGSIWVVIAFPTACMLCYRWTALSFVRFQEMMLNQSINSLPNRLSQIFPTDVVLGGD